MATHLLPKRYQRLMVARRASYDLEELASRTWGLLSSLRSLDVLFDLFRGDDADFAVCAAEHEAAVLKLLSAGAIDWYDIPRPPAEPAYRVRLVNFGVGEAYADLMLSWVPPGQLIEGRAPLSAELRIGAADEPGAAGPERGALLKRAFAELIRHFEADVAVAEMPATKPAARVGDLVPTVGWLTFVPAQLHAAARAVAAPLEWLDAPGGASIAVASAEPPFWDKDMAALDALRGTLLPVLENRGAQRAETPRESTGGARPQVVPSYLQAPPVQPIAPAAPIAPIAAPEPAPLPAPTLRVECLPAEGAAMDGLPWRQGDRDFLTIALKLCFDLHTGALASSEPVVAADRFLMSDANRSVVRANELVPFLPGAEILVLGYAEVPLRTTTITSLTVRNPEVVVLHKQVLVRPTGKEGEDPARVPLIYEGSFGGPGFENNPVGLGHRGSGIPTLFPPDQSLRLVGYGPLSPFWAQRSSLLAPGDRAQLARTPLHVPVRLSFDYFHAAPPDQRFADYLRGDESILLEGFRATPLELRLPSVTGVAFIQVSEGPRTTLELRVDMVVVDLGRGRVSVILRGCSELAAGMLDPASAGERIVVMGGYGLEGNAHYPAMQTAEPARQQPEPIWDEETAGPGTLVGAVAPFPLAPASAAPAAPGAPPWASTAPLPVPRNPLGQTIDLPDPKKKP